MNRKNIRVPEETHYKIKLQASKEGKSISDLLLEMIEKRKQNHSKELV